MRKFFTSLSLLIAVSSFSTILSPNDALQRALADSEGPMRAPSTGEVTLLETFYAPSGNPSIYFFKDNTNSWMVVSASDATDALLGYGDTYSADVEMPPQMRWWLSQYSAQVAYSDSILTYHPEMSAMESNSDMYKSPSKARPTPIPPLMKTKWNQSAPYNLYSPEVNGQKTPTGCVATAMAQVMKYHNYPPAAKGSGSATAGGEEFFMDLEKTFAWDDMLDTYSSGNYTESQAEAVADLMLIAGYSCKMQYAPGGSGAYNVDANRALVENFSYAPSAWAYYRDHYSTQEWKDMLYEELQSGRPIYYSGYSSGGGHAFVCDGCNVLGYFHYNWGWGGSYDGYFKIDALNPSGQGIGGFAGGYNNGQVAFLGVTPPTGTEERPAVQLSSFDTLSAKLIEDSQLSMECECYNYSYIDTNFSVCLELRNTTTNESLHTESFTEEIPPYYGYDEITFDLSSINLKDGQYTARIMTKTEEYPEWLPVLVPYDTPKYALLSKSGQTWQIEPYDSEYEESGVQTICMEDGIYDVYSISGTLLHTGVQRKALHFLKSGIYILRQGEKSVKIVL